MPDEPKNPVQHSSILGKSEIKILARLLKRRVDVIYAPDLWIDFREGFAQSHQITFWIHRRKPDFINLTTDWIQTDCDDYHAFVIEWSKDSGDIPFGRPEAAMGPCSHVDVEIGCLRKMEILQSTTRYLSLEDDLIEVIQVDQVLNFIGEYGSFSIATEVGPILGYMKVRPKAIYRVDELDFINPEYSELAIRHVIN